MLNLFIFVRKSQSYPVRLQHLTTTKFLLVAMINFTSVLEEASFSKTERRAHDAASTNSSSLLVKPKTDPRKIKISRW